MEQSVGFIAGLHFFITMGNCKTEYGKTRRNMFCPFRLQVSVTTCNSLNSCLLSTGTPAAGVSVINLPTHRHPTPVGIGRQQSRLLQFTPNYRHLQPKKEDHFFSGPTAVFVLPYNNSHVDLDGKNSTKAF